MRFAPPLLALLVASEFVACTSSSPSNPSPSNPSPSNPSNVESSCAGQCGLPDASAADGSVVDASSVPKLIALTLEVSAEIPTVVVASWSLQVASDEIERARVHFGRPGADEDLVAPVDLKLDRDAGADETAFRTVLLGMKPNTQYAVHVEVSTKSGSGLESATNDITTGLLPSAVPRVVVEDFDPTQLFGGYTVACTGPGGGSPWAFIWDRDGDVVWARSIADIGLDACVRARMAYDGRALWVGDLNLSAGENGHLAKLDLTGGQPPEVFDLPGRHHDFAVLPNGNLLYFRQELAEDAGAGAKRDVIYEFDPLTQNSQPIYDEGVDFAEVIGEIPAHTNYIAFVPELNAISFSMLASNTVGLISYPEGRLLNIFGGAQSNFDMSWARQHGHELKGGKFRVFSNQGPNVEIASTVMEYDVDLQSKSSELSWQYVSEDQTATFGDVKTLPNGNLLITYSNAGAIHELNAVRTLLRRTTSLGMGYVEHRASLYGPPPPFSD